MKPELAIIGYGRFGRLAGRYLKAHFTVFAADRTLLKVAEAGVQPVSMKEAAAKSTILLAVPINALPKILAGIAPVVKPDALILDVCSVKERPIDWMLSVLPKTVQIIGTHPLFGPDSAEKSVEGRNLILCPARASDTIVAELETGLKSAGLNVFTMTAVEHDQLMASTLFLTQFIGRALGDNFLPTSVVTTQNFENLRELVQTTANDSPELFRDMFEYNRFARDIPSRVIQRLAQAKKNLTGS
jgi:prephenate dehydrogenase